MVLYLWYNTIFCTHSLVVQLRFSRFSSSTTSIEYRKEGYIVWREILSLHLFQENACFLAIYMYEYAHIYVFFTLIKASDATTRFQDRAKRDHIRQHSPSLHLFKGMKCFLAISLYGIPTFYVHIH